MDAKLDVEPEQPAAVARALAELIAGTAADQVDPWWRAGIDDALAVSLGRRRPL